MKPGDIALIRFPFSDLESTKKRPGLILSRVSLSSKIEIVTIAMITSRVDGLAFPADCMVQSWKEAGLLHPSLIRLAKVASIEADLIDRILGRLETADLKRVKNAFAKHFRSWIE